MNNHCKCFDDKGERVKNWHCEYCDLASSQYDEEFYQICAEVEKNMNTCYNSSSCDKELDQSIEKVGEIVENVGVINYTDRALCQVSETVEAAVK